MGKITISHLCKSLKILHFSTCWCIILTFHIQTRISDHSKFLRISFIFSSDIFLYKIFFNSPKCTGLGTKSYFHATLGQKSYFVVYSRPRAEASPSLFTRSSWQKLYVDILQAPRMHVHCQGRMPDALPHP